MDRTAVLLAAGCGRKFWPYNEVRNKCAFPIFNKPVIRRLAEQLLEVGFKRLAVVVGFEEGSVRAALRSLDQTKITFVRQPTNSPGTTPAILSAIDTCSLESSDPFLVVYGDTVLSTSDIKTTWEQFRSTGAAAGALCAPLGDERTQDWITGSKGEVNQSGGQSLRDIAGHGRGGSHRLTGLYVLSAAAIPYLRAQTSCMIHVPVGGMPPSEPDIADSIANIIDDGLDVIMIETTGYFVDLDKPWHILEASEMVVREQAELLTLSGSVIDPSAQIDDGAEINGPIVVGPGARIGKRVVLEGPSWIGANAKVVNGAIIGKGVMIGARTRVSDYCLVSSGSVIGNECVVGHGGEFEGVMLDRSYIYHYSEIWGVLGLAVDIGAATVCGTLRFDDGDTIHKISGRRERSTGNSNATYFGDYTRTGVNVITQPGVKIGSYCCVGPGIVVYQDIPSHKLILLKQETIERDWGPERYGW